jgi:hypothetical protein
MPTELPSGPQIIKAEHRAQISFVVKWWRQMSPPQRILTVGAFVCTLVSVLGWCLSNFFTIRGVNSMIASRVLLFFMLLSGTCLFCVFVWAVAFFKRKALWSLTSFLCWLAIVIFLDWWAPRPQIAQAPSVAPTSAPIADNNRPDLVPYLDQITMKDSKSDDGKPEVHIILIADISNRGAESNVFGMRLELETPDGRVTEAPLAHPAKPIVYQRFPGDPQSIVYTGNDLLEKKTSDHPIARNGNVMGLIYAVISNARVNDFNYPGQTKVKLSIKDVLDKPSSVEDTYNPDGKMRIWYGVGSQPLQYPSPVQTATPPKSLQSHHKAASVPTRRDIQGKLAGFSNDGELIQKEFYKHAGQGGDAQKPASLAVSRWHEKIEAYLKTIPAGNIYLARFNNEVPGNGVYPVGINLDVMSAWDQLQSDLARLNEFMKDTDLGNP